MKNLLSTIVASLILIACNQTKTAETSVPSLTKIWETDTLLKTPESVLLNPADSTLFVSCINATPPNAKDGDGYIAIISAKDGSIINPTWVSGLHAPKGMGLLNGKLYVADIDAVVVIDINSASIIESYPVAAANFLNDIDISSKGEVFITDSGTDKLHMIQGDSVVTLITSKDFNRPNGLAHLGSKLVMATSKSGNFYEINTTDWSYKMITDSIFGGDGVEPIGDDYVVSSWNGRIYYVTNAGKKTLMLDTDGQFNTADFELLQNSKTVLVPTFFGNQVIAYSLEN